MNERFARQVPITSRRRPEQVIPLRPLADVSRRAPGDLLPFALPMEKETIAMALHAIQNCLQVVGMGIDLLQLTGDINQEDSGQMRRSSEKANRLLLELREYWCPPEPHPWVENLADTVESIVQGAALEWAGPGHATRVRNHNPCETFEADWGQVEKALGRVIFCAYAMLPSESGEVLVEASVQALGGQQFIQIEIRIRDEAPLSVEERMLFSPFISVNGYELGLSLVLAQRTAVRLGGHLLFHKINPQEAYFLLYFRI